MTLAELLAKIEEIDPICLLCNQEKPKLHKPNCELKIAQSRLSLVENIDREVIHSLARRERVFKTLGVKVSHE